MTIILLKIHNFHKHIHKIHKHHKLIAIDLSKQNSELENQQINFTGI